MVALVARDVAPSVAQQSETQSWDITGKKEVDVGKKNT
jgi:hypothetical protein